MDELHPRSRLLLHLPSPHRPPPDLTPTSGRLFVTGSTPFTPTSLARIALTTGSAATFRTSLNLSSHRPVPRPSVQSSTPSSTRPGQLLLQVGPAAAALGLPQLLLHQARPIYCYRSVQAAATDRPSLIWPCCSRPAQPDSDPVDSDTTRPCCTSPSPTQIHGQSDFRHGHPSALRPRHRHQH
jgi:hypothetical protein